MAKLLFGFNFLSWRINCHLGSLDCNYHGGGGRTLKNTFLLVDLLSNVKRLTESKTRMRFGKRFYIYYSDGSNHYIDFVIARRHDR